jgi:translation initiation factor 3 subunit C
MKKDVFGDLIRSIRGHIKNNDYSGLATDYTDTIKAFEKQAGSGETPKGFIRALYELSSFISELQASGATKKMSQIKAQAVNKLKAQMNKGNKAFEEELEKCLENPSEYDILGGGNEDEDSDSGNESDSEDASCSEISDSDSDSDSGSDSDSDSDSDSSDSSNSDSDSDSSFSGSSAESSDWDMSEESSSDEETDEIARRERRMRRWLKDSDESDYETVPKKQEAVRRPKKKVVVPANGQSTIADEQEEEAEAPIKTGPTAMELPEKELIEKSRDLLTGKTKLGEGGRQTLTELDELMAAALAQWGPICYLTIAVSTVSYMFDDASSGLAKSGYIPDDLLLNAKDRITTIMALMKKTDKAYPVSIHELVPHMVVDADAENAKRRRLSGNGMVSLLAELVDDEFCKSFQALDLSESPNQYAQRLGLLPDIVALLLAVREYMASENQGSARASSRLLWHMHYQSAKSMQVLTCRVAGFAINPDLLVESVFSYGSKKDKAGAILLSAFIAGSRGDFVKAKRLISADLFDLVAVSEVSLQIQYNRALAMVGVAAFAAGETKDCYSLLTDICSTGRIRELLAQGVTRQVGGAVEKSAEVDRAERRRLLPFHMHLNIELVEAAYGLSAMILEAPQLAKSMGSDVSSRRLGKYKRQLESYDRQLFSGPAESSKDAVALAGKALLNDDVHRAVALVDGMKIWDNMPEGHKVRSRTVDQVRVTGLQTYLVNNAGCHKSFELSLLAASFGLSTSAVSACICRMIIAGDVAGRIRGDFFVPAVVAVSKLKVYTDALEEQVNRLETIQTAGLESASSADLVTEIEREETKELVAKILAELADPEKEIGARRVRKAALSNAKALAASQLAAERRLQAGLAKRRGWDNARVQAPQGQVISTERKRLFGKSYGY